MLLGTRARSRRCSLLPGPEARSRARSAPARACPGGLFTPSLFYGAALGGAAGRAARARLPRPRAARRARARRDGGRARRDDARGGLLGAHHLRDDGRLRRHPAAHALGRDRRRDEPRDRARLALHRAAPPPRRAAPGAAARRSGSAARRSRRSSSRTRRAWRPRPPFEEVLKKLLSLAARPRSVRHDGGRRAPRRHPARRAEGDDLGRARSSG